MSQYLAFIGEIYELILTHFKRNESNFEISRHWENIIMSINHFISEVLELIQKDEKKHKFHNIVLNEISKIIIKIDLSNFESNEIILTSMMNLFLKLLTRLPSHEGEKIIENMNKNATLKLSKLVASFSSIMDMNISKSSIIENHAAACTIYVDWLDKSLNQYESNDNNAIILETLEYKQFYFQFNYKLSQLEESCVESLEDLSSKLILFYINFLRVKGEITLNDTEQVSSLILKMNNFRHKHKTLIIFPALIDLADKNLSMSDNLISNKNFDFFFKSWELAQDHYDISKFCFNPECFTKLPKKNRDALFGAFIKCFNAFYNKIFIYMKKKNKAPIINNDFGISYNSFVISLENLILCAKLLKKFGKKEIADNMMIFDALSETYYNKSMVLLPSHCEILLRNTINEYKNDEYKFCLFLNVLNIDLDFEAIDFELFANVLDITDQTFYKNNNVYHTGKLLAQKSNSKIWFVLFHLASFNELIPINQIKQFKKTQFLQHDKALKKFIKLKERIIELINDVTIQKSHLCDLKFALTHGNIILTFLDNIFYGIDKLEKYIFEVALMNRATISNLAIIYSDYQSNLMTHASNTEEIYKALLFNYMISKNLFYIIRDNHYYLLPTFLLTVLYENSNLLKILRWITLTSNFVHELIQTYGYRSYKQLCPMIYLPSKLIKFCGTAFIMKLKKTQLDTSYLYKKAEIMANFRKSFLIFIETIVQNHFIREDKFIYKAVSLTLIHFIEAFIKMRDKVDIIKAFVKNAKKPTKIDYIKGLIEDMLGKGRNNDINNEIIQLNNNPVLSFINEMISSLFNFEYITLLHLKLQKYTYFELGPYLKQLNLPLLKKYYLICRNNVDKSVSNIFDDTLESLIRKDSNMMNIKTYERYDKALTNELLNLCTYKEYLTFISLNDIELIHQFDFFLVEALALKKILGSLTPFNEQINIDNIKNFDLQNSIFRWIDNCLRVYYYISVCTETKVPKQVLYKPLMRTVVEIIVQILTQQELFTTKLGVDLINLDQSLFQKLCQILFHLFHVDDNLAVKFIESEGLQKLLTIKALRICNVKDANNLNLLFEYYFKNSMPIENIIEIEIKRLLANEDKHLSDLNNSKLLYHYISMDKSNNLFIQILTTFYTIHGNSKLQVINQKGK